MRVSLEGGSKNFLVDRKGRVVSADYNGDSIMSDIVRIHTRGDLALEMMGVPGAYKQQLFNKDGSPASEVFGSIGYFYNGIAPVERDGKIGFIGGDGSTLLEPCIEYDDLRYPPDYKGYWCYYLTEDAIVLPIDSEFAVITLTRE